MHDLVIRGGTIVDGTGKPGFTGDVAIDNGKLTQVGGKAGPAQRDVAAEGRLVTPGWVDVHTHYDGQATWDGEMAPSSWHGSTTVVFGNCGVGFAPCRPRDRTKLIELMEGVEDIPGLVLSEGLKWNWQSFPEFLDVLERLPRTIDIGAQVTHHPLRVFVMGDRAIRHEQATAEDVAEMARLTEEGLRAGALGFTTSRTQLHMTLAGDYTPGRFAGVDELKAIGRALGRAGHGNFGMLADFEDETADFAWMRDIARESGRPVWFLLTDRIWDPTRWRRLMAGVQAARQDGLPLTAQIAARPVGLILGLSTSLTPFSTKASFMALAHLPPEERLKRLRDPAVRRQIIDEAPDERLVALMPRGNLLATTHWSRMYVHGDPPDYEPDQSRCVETFAAKEGKTPAEFVYDYLTGGDGSRMLFFPVTNYVTGDHGPIRDMMTSEHTVVGLSDGGAHYGVICDASNTTFLLTHWARDRKRGEKLPVEFVVKRQTADNADFFGLRDRGRLAPGLKADINVIDHAGLRLHPPEIIHDLPAGGRRLVQRVDGYDMTLVSGTPIYENGQSTGARPGKLVRGSRP